MVQSLDLSSVKDSSTRRALRDLSHTVAKSKKIIIVTGAGISCSSGIPDFRSSDGLYALVKQQYPDVVLKGRDLFDASLFRDTTSTAVFFTFISQLKKSIDSAAPTPTHHFIKTLDTKKKLLRSYTQNIDGLEEKVGLLSSSSHEAKSSGKGKSKIQTRNVRNVQLHGDIHRVRCQTCSAEYPCTPEHLSFFNEGTCPDCPECLERAHARKARSARAIKVGTLRPAIVLYDEPHPLGDDIGTIQGLDVARKPDLLIIMGTSLKVHGLKKLIKDFAKTVHASSSSSSPNSTGKVIFVNRTPPGSEWSGVIDYHVAGDTDTWVEKVVEDWKKLRPSDWEVQQTLLGTNGEALFKTVKDTSKLKTKDSKKKPNPDEENLRPSSSMNMVLSPERLSMLLEKPALTPPSSPTKRRQAASHYSDIESSPSKKRAPPTKPEIRVPLFSYNQSVDMDADLGALAADLSMQSPPKTKPPAAKNTAARPAAVRDISMQDLTKPKKAGRTRKLKDDVFT
ncbi:DHS-like NAD/FAD-binding domain-containing protein [Mycena floridula]|nr:DHS-like NAD/FAD-binding domain-containing protein [Mycena floridula]